jgi:hypothetical protein
MCIQTLVALPNISLQASELLFKVNPETLRLACVRQRAQHANGGTKLVVLGPLSCPFQPSLTPILSFLEFFPAPSYLRTHRLRFTRKLGTLSGTIDHFGRHNYVPSLINICGLFDQMLADRQQ